MRKISKLYEAIKGKMEQIESVLNRLHMATYLTGMPLCEEIKDLTYNGRQCWIREYRNVDDTDRGIKMLLPNCDSEVGATLSVNLYRSRQVRYVFYEYAAETNYYVEEVDLDDLRQFYEVLDGVESYLRSVLERHLKYLEEFTKSDLYKRIVAEVEFCEI